MVDASRVLGPPGLPATLEQLTAVAAEQLGLVTRAQCQAAGMSFKAIEVRLVRGRWVRVHRGVYQTLPGRDDWWTTATAAHLACGVSAAWSHETAAFVWGLIATPPRDVDVLIDDQRRLLTPAGVRIHRSLHVDRRCDPLVWPWRTTVDETILDLGATATLDATLALVGRAFQRRLTSERPLLARLAERARHRHRAALKLVLSDVASGAESALEIRYLRGVERAHGLPEGRRQEPNRRSGAGAFRLRDVAYPDQRVVVELDGRLGHEQHSDRVRDGRRDRDSAVDGWLTVRVFWSDVTPSPCALAGDVGAVLSGRGWLGRPRHCRRAGCEADRLNR